ncbi:MAG: hypothetical protein ACR2JD_07420 [Nocardioides sp.]
MFPPHIHDLLLDQSGVVARRQLLGAGMRPHDIERWRRRKDLALVHPGVYVDQTGDPTWLQRAWAGVLWCGSGAALWGESALRAHEGPGKETDQSLIHVAVDRMRGIDAPTGVRVHRKVRLDDRVLWNLRPARQRYEDAALEVALARRDRLDALGVLAGAVQQRRTTAGRLVDSLKTRPRASHRDWIEAVLRDLAEGTCSVLEHGYLTDVERAHGLPTSVRQATAKASVGLVYRDHEYDVGLVVELDGRLFHDSARQRDRDLERDLDAALDGKDTRRLGWGQVFDRPCSTAGKVARLLCVRGWPGRPHGCAPDCRVLESFTRAA